MFVINLDVEAITRAFFEFSVAQDEFYEAVTVAGRHDAIRERMMVEVREADGRGNIPHGWDTGEWALYPAHVTSAPLRIYQA
ncbi:MAG: hypothetical protein E7Z94_04380 [Actinomyces ruminicola]|uniref:Uncharacterized protein n=1 Tax=Actinomyces ruminicola TaxID=332524 RepID=A0A1G9SZY5_9ACTO|nr:hypothetical protein [Actinomyces ruminicola]MBE6481607.1 hypothetical protein [Actinomyces ruminicola]SDM41001.1 hypothetical protein SAMN04487766_102160 [Actinomyces ruminicola]